MPMVITNNCGTRKMRSVLSRTCWRVVSTSSTAMETESSTRMKKMIAESIPCRVIDSVHENSLNETSGSPGVTKLNIAGTTIKSENIGTNRRVRSRKNKSPIDETPTRMSTAQYITESSAMLLEISTATNSSIVLRTFKRGSRFCRKPLRPATSSTDTVCLSRETVAKMVRSRNPPAFFALTYMFPFWKVSYRAETPGRHISRCQQSPKRYTQGSDV